MRTWDENRTTINQLWPQCKWTDEERRLWHDDLHGLDQDVLYDAVRNVKRNNESLYPQLKWVRDEYRQLHRLKTFAARKTLQTGEPRQVVKIDKDVDSRMGGELRVVVEMATAADYELTVDLIADKAASLQIELATAFRLCRYLRQRLGIDNGMSFGGAA